MTAIYFVVFFTTAADGAVHKDSSLTFSRLVSLSRTQVVCSHANTTQHEAKFPTHTHTHTHECQCLFRGGGHYDGESLFQFFLLLWCLGVFAPRTRQRLATLSLPSLQMELHCAKEWWRFCIQCLERTSATYRKQASIENYQCDYYREARDCIFEYVYSSSWKFYYFENKSCAHTNKTREYLARQRAQQCFHSQLSRNIGTRILYFGIHFLDLDRSRQH